MPPQASRLTWRERAELGDFLEWLGALLVQQLDGLQAQRGESAALKREVDTTFIRKIGIKLEGVGQLLVRSAAEFT